MAFSGALLVGAKCPLNFRLFAPAVRVRFATRLPRAGRGAGATVAVFGASNVVEGAGDADDVDADGDAAGFALVGSVLAAESPEDFEADVVRFSAVPLPTKLALLLEHEAIRLRDNPINLKLVPIKVPLILLRTRSYNS